MDCDITLARLANAAFAVGLVRYGLFYAQLRLLLLREQRGLVVSEADWLRLADFVLGGSNGDIRKSAAMYQS
jgi:hypothetical protein